jgi:hypothetical protein
MPKKKQTNGERLIEVLKEEGPIAFMACLGFEFDEEKGIFYTHKGFGTNWLVTDDLRK